MRLLFVMLASLLLAGCPSMGYYNMSPEQIKATAGTISCSTVNSVYGKGSAIAVNADDIRKGATSTGAVTISCGEASMVIKSEVGTK